MNAQTGKPITDLEHLRQSIRDILTTPIGSRVMRRDYGSRVPDLVDQPMTPRLAVAFYAAVAEALYRWEPRFRLTRVRVTGAQPGWLEIELEGEVRLPGFTGRLVTLSGIGIGGD